MIYEDLIVRNALEQKSAWHVNDLSMLDRQKKMDVLNREPSTLVQGAGVEDASIVAENDAKLANTVSGVARTDTYVRPKSNTAKQLMEDVSAGQLNPKQLDRVRSDIDDFNRKEGYESSDSYISRMPGHFMPSATGGDRPTSSMRPKEEYSGVTWHRDKTAHYRRLHEIIRTLRQLRELHDENSPKIYALARGSAAGVIPDSDGIPDSEHK